MPIVIDTNLIRRNDPLLKEGCIVPKIANEQELKNIIHPCKEVPTPKEWGRYGKNIMLRDLKGVCRKTAQFPRDVRKCELNMGKKWVIDPQSSYQYMKLNHPHSKLKEEFNTFKRGGEVDSAFLRTAEEHKLQLVTADKELFEECKDIKGEKGCRFIPIHPRTL